MQQKKGVDEGEPLNPYEDQEEQVQIASYSFFLRKTELIILLRETRIHGVSLAADGAAVTKWMQP